MKTTNRRMIVGLVALSVLASSWVIFAQFFIPRLIESAYRGESIPIFNGMIAGQAVNPVSYYLSRWDEAYRRISAYALILLPVIALVVFLWTRPAVQDFLNVMFMPSKRLPEAELLATVGRARVRLVYALVTFFVVFSLQALITDHEHWPFSQYGMYSEVQRDRSLTTLRLFGVTTDESKRIPLLDFQYIQPFDPSRLRLALEGMDVQSNREQLLTDALRDCLARYEMLRLAGRHDGPRLQGLELNRVSWELDPWARNVDRPQRSETLLRVTQ